MNAYASGQKEFLARGYPIERMTCANVRAATTHYRLTPSRRHTDRERLKDQELAHVADPHDDIVIV